ncbi:MAG: YebC/PmpR family DNA-binding transcriptional regulator [Anaerolineaceae bacterium 4572_32.1]|nr:MAG: YebC/PmpR family DNA-binding transcriptional regulator [Anaerolineaceae bacterium 4572_32.1]
MSGHSKWSTIKRKKASVDAKRGKLFTKIGRELVIAAGKGGPDPEVNFNLRLIIDKAKAANMPKDNIERAIRRGAGLEKGAKALEEVTYEGYGPGGVALLVQVLTDNRNRAVANIRREFAHHGGNLGESGCVAWQFDAKGYITIEADKVDPDRVFDIAVESGADDVIFGQDLIEIVTDFTDLNAVKESLSAQQMPINSAEVSMIPKTTISLSEKEILSNMGLIDALEELDDVQQVYSNLDISDEAMSAYEAKS